MDGGIDMGRESAAVLVVEDEISVLEVLEMLIRSNGYAVISAASLDEAHRKTEAYPGGIFLLLTDVRLRQGTGPEVTEMIRLLRPGTAITFMSGHAPESVLKPGDMLPGDGFVAKPFVWKDLFARIRDTKASHEAFLRPSKAPGEG